MPVPVVLSTISTAGPTPRTATSFNVEKIAMESVNVAVAKPETLTVALPGFVKTSVKGTGPGVTSAVSPVSVTVTSAFVNDVPPRVPEALVVSE
jgi:hypothetical protein